MRVQRLLMENFRGVNCGVVEFSGHTLLVGGNNAGKSTVCEALDLVLGPERLFRRPVVDEHDFFHGRYLNDDGSPVQIRIQAILVALSDEATLRFRGHLRRWNQTTRSFADESEDGPETGDAEGTSWALPLVFVGQYDAEEDDFIGNTFFDHPEGEPGEEDSSDMKLGGGRRPFTRSHKRLCGFVFLRALRTGSRALSLQRGSLLDTILKIGGEGSAEMWKDTLKRLHDMDPAVGEIAQLKKIRAQIRDRMARFVNLAPGEEATAFFASDLTRESLREVVRLFIAAAPTDYQVPFQRLGTGSVNMLVFALLTFIAELKGKQSVIFAMEEPEIALPPHTQRRVTRFVLEEMGQAIVTSHSPHVIEQFEPEQIVMLQRPERDKLLGSAVDLRGFRPGVFQKERRQFAEAILAPAVLVVEGSTEGALFPIASSVLEKSRGGSYMHLDLVGVTIFNAGADNAVPRFGPIFQALGKMAFGFYDEPKTPFPTDSIDKLGAYARHWQSPQKGIESLLVEEMPVTVLRRFLEAVKSRSDYPQGDTVTDEMTDAAVKTLAQKVLKDRKGDAYGYAALLVAQASNESELPRTICEILTAIQDALVPPSERPQPRHDSTGS